MTLNSNKVALLAIAGLVVMLTAGLTIGEVRAEDGTAVIPIATPVEIASLAGIIAGTVIKQANTWIETPDDQSFNKHHVAFILATLGAVAGSLSLFGNIPLPSNPPSLLMVGVFSLVAGWGAQSIAAKTITGFGNTAPSTTPATKPATTATGG